MNQFIFVQIYYFSYDEKVYMISNFIDKLDVSDREIYDVIALEFLNSLRISCFPNHIIKFKTPQKP